MAHKMQRDKTARTIRLEDLNAEHFVREYMALIDEGWTPEVGEFLARAPEHVREDAESAILAAVQSRNERAAAQDAGVSSEDFYDLGVEVALEDGDAPPAEVHPIADTDEPHLDDTPDAADARSADEERNATAESDAQAEDLAPSALDDDDMTAPDGIVHKVDLMQLNADRSEGTAPVELLADDGADEACDRTDPHYCGGSCDCAEPCGAEAESDVASDVEPNVEPGVEPDVEPDVEDDAVDPLAMFETRADIPVPAPSFLSSEPTIPEAAEAIEEVTGLRAIADAIHATTVDDDLHRVAAVVEHAAPAETQTIETASALAKLGNETVAESSALDNLGVETALDATADAEAVTMPELTIPSELESELTSERSDGDPIVPGYRVEEHLGNGTLGATYTAWDDLHKRRVVLKMLPREDAGMLRGRMEPDSSRVAALGDPTLVGFDAVAEGGDGPAMVRNCIEGEPFDVACQELSDKEVVRLLRAAARALATAHAEGIVHHDLKPENMLVTGARNVRIVDWGVGATGVVTEQPPYFAAPEMIAAREAWVEADVFSFGAVMYTALVQGVPFYSESRDEVRRLIRTTDPMFPRTARADVPLDLQAICLSCLARRSIERPSMEEVFCDLDRYLRGEAVLARPPQYAARLHKEAMERSAELGAWEQHGVLTRHEVATVDAVYRGAFEREQSWTYDATRKSVGEFCGILGAALVSAGSCVLALSAPVWGGVAATVLAVLLAGMAYWAHRRGDRARAVAFAMGGIAPLVVGTSLLVGGGTALAPLALLVGCTLGMLASVGWWIGIGHVGFSWWATATLTGIYAAGMALTGWPANGIEIAALLALPLVGWIGAGVAIERRARASHAVAPLMFGWVALVSAPAVWAWTTTAWSSLGIDALGAVVVAPALGIALHALLLWAVQTGLERVASTAMARMLRVMEWVVPATLLGVLAWNAWTLQTVGALALLATVSLTIGMLGLRQRRHPHVWCGVAALASVLGLTWQSGLASATHIAAVALGLGAVLTMAFYAFRVYSLRQPASQ